MFTCRVPPEFVAVQDPQLGGLIFQSCLSAHERTSEISIMFSGRMFK